MFNFFSRSGNKAPDLSFLGADVHSHLLPGLDDGVQDIHQSLEFIYQLEIMGYSKLICTPHILADVYKNSKNTILPKLDLVRRELSKAGSKIQLEAAAEYMIDIHFETLMRDKNNLLVFGKRYLLVEMSYMFSSPNFDKIIFDLKMMDIQPVLAHPERYNYYHHQFDQYERLIDIGCLLQVNLLSLSGYYGKPAKKVAERLLKADMVSFLGTDMHHERHLESLKNMVTRKEFLSVIEGRSFKNHSLL